MNQFGLEFHHFGLAVRAPGAARTLLTGLGYRLADVIFDPEQNVNLCMATHDAMPDVEIIFPCVTPGPVDRLIARHQNGIIYHLCFTTNDLTETLSRIAGAELDSICVVPPKPAVLFNGQPVSFHAITGIGLIEIIENRAG